MSSAVIHSAGGNNSGFVGWSRASGHEIHFMGCLFNGKLLQKDGNGGSNGGFIGWTGSNKTVTITNCLCAPAALASGETMADTNSATFARGWNDTTTATNSYYITALGAAQGTQLFAIFAGEGVTLSAATSYADGVVNHGGTLYAKAGASVSLTLGYEGTPATGYIHSGYEASAGTLDGTTLAMPAANVRVYATFTSLPFGSPDFTLPAALTAIEESAFEGLTGMTIVDASNCASIGKWAFKDCTGLMQIKLSQNCSVDPDAFDGCGTVCVFAPAGGTTETSCAGIDNCVFVAEVTD